ANAGSGRLLATVASPQLPFSRATVQLDGGARAPLANPLVCVPATSELGAEAYGEGSGATVHPTPASSSGSFAVSGCPTPLPFTVAQTTGEGSTLAGAATTFTLNLTREQGQQYLMGSTTTLPEGLLARIGSVPRCSEPAAVAGTCPAAARSAR
ncbi:MAG: hypothetical protein ACYDA6_07335, partial [Solirubrobacteraceae bacterium]